MTKRGCSFLTWWHTRMTYVTERKYLPFSKQNFFQAFSSHAGGGIKTILSFGIP